MVQVHAEAFDAAQEKRFKRIEDRNEATMAACRSFAAGEITRDELMRRLRGVRTQRAAPEPEAPPPRYRHDPSLLTPAEVRYVRLLREHGGKTALAAEALGMNKKTFRVRFAVIRHKAGVCSNAALLKVVE